MVPATQIIEAEFEEIKSAADKRLERKIARLDLTIWVVCWIIFFAAFNGF